MPKVLCLVYDTMADFELTLVCYAIAADGDQVIPVGFDREPVKALSGLTYLPAATLEEVLKWEDVRGLIIPGGWAREQTPALNALITGLNERGKLLAAICAGPKFLARAGVLKGRRYTTATDEDYFAKTGETDPFPWDTYVDEPVVTDGNIVTARGTSFVDFAAEVADWLGLFDKPEHKAMWAATFKGV